MPGKAIMCLIGIAEFNVNEKDREKKEEVVRSESQKILNKVLGADEVVSGNAMTIVPKNDRDIDGLPEDAIMEEIKDIVIALSNNALRFLISKGEIQEDGSLVISPETMRKIKSRDFVKEKPRDFIHYVSKVVLVLQELKAFYARSDEIVEIVRSVVKKDNKNYKN